MQLTTFPNTHLLAHALASKDEKFGLPCSVFNQTLCLMYRIRMTHLAIAMLLDRRKLNCNQNPGSNVF